MGRISFDPKIYDVLGELPLSSFRGAVYRVTAQGVDPLTFSSGGGRWGFPPTDPSPTAILYTSEQRDGAIAEVVSYYRLLSPQPSKPLVISKLMVELSRTFDINMDKLAELGVSADTYRQRAYRDPPARTQEIGATVNFVGADGFFAPSARYDCRNLMILSDNFSLENRLDLVSSEEFDWRDWAEKTSADLG